MSKFCSNCGKEVNENQDVCLNCGVRINNNTVVNNTEDKVDKNASVGFILGLVSIIAWFIPLFGYPVTICGIVFSSKGLKSKTQRGKALTGLILSIVFLVFSFINSIMGVIINLANYYYFY